MSDVPTAGFLVRRQVQQYWFFAVALGVYPFASADIALVDSPPIPCAYSCLMCTLSFEHVRSLHHLTPAAGGGWTSGTILASSLKIVGFAEDHDVSRIKPKNRLCRGTGRGPRVCVHACVCVCVCLPQNVCVLAGRRAPG